MHEKPPENNIEPIRIEADTEPKIIAGLAMRCNSPGEMIQIPKQWQSFATYYGRIPNRKNNITYGVCVEIEDGKIIDYITAVEVTDTKNLPHEFVIKHLPAFTYAVFKHDGHVSAIRNTCDLIWKEWVPETHYNKPKNADFFFERYGEAFDPQKGSGDIEIWIPVEE